MKRIRFGIACFLALLPAFADNTDHRETLARSASRSETANSPPLKGLSLAQALVAAAGDKPGLTVVCLGSFGALPPLEKLRCLKGQTVAKRQGESRLVKTMLTEPRMEDFPGALRLFRVVFVDVGAVLPEACEAVNLLNAPYTGVLDVDGKLVGSFGPGICTKQQILGALKAAIKPKLDLDKFMDKERELRKTLMLLDSRTASLAIKRVNFPPAEVARLEAELKTTRESAKAQVEEIDAYLADKGLKRIP